MSSTGCAERDRLGDAQDGVRRAKTRGQVGKVSCDCRAGGIGARPAARNDRLVLRTARAGVWSNSAGELGVRRELGFDIGGRVPVTRRP